MWKYMGVQECNEFLLSLNLFDCKDSKKYIKTLYSIANNVEKNYRIFKIKKRNGKYRKIYEPSKLLKEIQRNILSNILEERKVSKYAMAYYKGRQLRDNAAPHVNKDIVLKLDIKDFFDNISFMNVYNACFPIVYYPKSVGMLLTYLCTYNDHLTQGSPTSAYISNLVMRDFDEEIGRWCMEHDIDYTRYSDDMTFSGNFDVSELIKFVRTKLCKLGLELNGKKIHVVYKDACQNVTGIVVNEKAQVGSQYRKEIRKEVYYISKYGLKDHMKRCKLDNTKEYLDSLYGRILYVLQVNKYDKEFKKYKKIVNEIKETTK